MSEELEVKQEEKVEAKPEVEVEVQVSPVEESARGQGWVSKEEWVESGRDEAEWRPAKEFVERGEIFKTLHDVRRELKKEKAAREALQKHHQYVFEKAHLKAIEDLKRERRAAIRSEDLETAEAIAEEIDELKEKHEQEKQAVQQEVQRANVEQGYNPEFQMWIEKNKWYLLDNDLRDEADAAALVYMKRNQNATPAQLLDAVEKKLRQRFPDKFGVKKAAPNAVAGVNRASTKAKVADVELDDMEQEIMRQLIASGEMTEAEYKAEIKKTRIK